MHIYFPRGPREEFGSLGLNLASEGKTMNIQNDVLSLTRALGKMSFYVSVIFNGGI